MAKLQPLVNSFHGGQISPLLSMQVGSELYNSSLLAMENAIAMVEGPAARVPGSRFVAATKGSGEAVLVPFIYSATDRYMIEVGNCYMRFYRAGGQVMSGAAAYELTTAIAAAELPYLQFYQSADVMFITTGARWPQKLVRSGHTSWAIDDADIEDGPWLTENPDTGYTITPSAVTGTGINLVASGDLFTSGNVGYLWKVCHIAAEQKTTGSFTSTGNSAAIFCGVGGAWEAVVTGVWSGSIELQASYDGGSTWLAIYTISSANDNNEHLRRKTPETNTQGVWFRLVCGVYTSGTANYQLYIPSYVHTGIVRVKTVSDAQNATADVITRLGGTTATTRWAEGAWSTRRGFPAAVFPYGERVCYASTPTEPLDVWGSASGDYERFLLGTLDTDPFEWTISAAAQNPIRWVSPQRNKGMVVGTLGEILELQPADETMPITANNAPAVVNRVAVPCAAVPPVQAEGSVIFAWDGGKILSELLYSAQDEALYAPELTRRAGAIAGDGVTQLAWQSRPYSLLWARTADDQLITLAYNRTYQVAAWSCQPDPVPADALYRSVAAMPGEDGQDEVWWICKRTVGSSYVMCVEQMQPWDIDAAVEDGWFLRSAKQWDGGDAVDVTDITKASPAVVTVADWPTMADGTAATDGDNIRIREVVGMTQINERVFTMANCDSGALTFELKNETGTADWDSSAYTTYTSGGTAQLVENTFAGMDHLAGEAVDCLADGAVIEGLTAGATISLGAWVNKVLVGLAYTTNMVTVPLEFGFSSGPSTGKTKRASGAIVSVYNSGPFLFGTDKDHTKRAGGKVAATGLLGPVPLSTGEISVGIDSTFERAVSLVIQQDLPLPLVVRAVMPDVGIYGP